MINNNINAAAIFERADTVSVSAKLLISGCRFSHAKAIKLQKPASEYLRTNFYVTTSGNFSTPALLCSIMEMGIDRVLFSVDWPYIDNAQGTKWLKAAPVSDKDRALIFEGNARKLLKM